MNPEDLPFDIINQFRKNSTQRKVFDLLADQQWHCRRCEGSKIGSGQYAGGGGIQGLQRGTKSRPGLIIETASRYCENCKLNQLQDRWTGNLQPANSSTNISLKLAKKVLEFYAYRDVIEQRTRSVHELIIDHRFPMERWGDTEPPHDADMTPAEIKQKFQLLKKDSAGNHNLLKSRSCERCIKTNKRGTPLGIKFYYEGDENWPADVPVRGKDAEIGCVGCGWYDFETWRDRLNQKIAQAD
ncbi:restriction endonuclease [Laspinema palackyanum]|uniref:restriction endonuclease n=1 Tax=Laspinema palackyanum TaxID=3231601 RepID=UPI00345D52DA|nr:restriction endonuclease [Laspinema sp. D2c]